MKQRNESITAVGSAGLLKGLLLHGIHKSYDVYSKLLLTPSPEETKKDLDSGVSFRVSTDRAEHIATEVATDYWNKIQESGKTRHNNKVIGGILRVYFRLAAMKAKTVNDPNFNVDEVKSGESQVQEGLVKTLEVMNDYHINWDNHVADVIMDECMRVGDVSGVHFVSEMMWRHKLWARTSTFNALLRRYAESGDGESAYYLVKDVMQQVIRYH